MTEKEKLNIKAQYLSKLSKNITNSNEVFEQIKKEHPELIDERLNSNNDDGSSKNLDNIDIIRNNKKY